jgi:cell wall-associated NlpC family hydrolase
MPPLRPPENLRRAGGPPASLTSVSPPRKTLACLGCLLVVAVLSGCGGSGNAGAGQGSTADSQTGPAVAKADQAATKAAADTDPTDTKPRSPGAKADPQGATKGAATGAAKVKRTTVKTPDGRRVEVAEVADPEEAKSFPLAASSVHHQSASSPSVAGEAAVAAGAPSDAEVKRELNEMHAVERTAAQTQRQELTPVAGGESVGGNGTIPIPTNAPEAVQRVVAGGNAIADFPYIWGGGHASFIANGYDCSGSVSYALAAGGLLSAPLVSGDLASWGEPGPGRWITIYANAGHTFMDVDGMWFDTAGRSGPYASRWLVATPALAGYSVRHPQGL